jgi:hypothetical protein
VICATKKWLKLPGYLPIKEIVDMRECDRSHHQERIMTVNPLNSGNNYVSQVQPQPQSQVERVAEKENDKDNDDAKKKAAAAASVPVQPTVNTIGQKVGQVISVKAT